MDTRDWVAESRLPAIEIGRFQIIGSTDTPRKGALPVRIDAGLAFGTGRHESTEGCLLALSRLYPGKQGPALALDLGTGSGILAIALAKGFGSRVIASDIDPVAADVATRNAEINRVSHRIMTVVSAGFDHPTLRGLYDLVVANILAEPLTEMAPDICASVSGNGRVILSGLLATQADSVASAYEPHGLKVEDSLRLREWVTLVLTPVSC